MGSKFREFQHAFAAVFNPEIQTCLLNQLAENARSISELFTKLFPQDRTNLPALDEQIEKNPFKQLLSYAPTAVCNLLVEELITSDVTEFLRILTTTCDTQETLLAIIMHHAPVETRVSLVEKIKRLDAEQQIKLLFNGHLNYPDFRNFLKLMNINDCNSSIALIEILIKINPQTLFAIFHTPSFSGFIELFKRTPPENVAMALLRLLDHFEGHHLSVLIKDRDTGFFNFLQDQNLLHLIFKKQSPRVITELLIILRKLSIEDIKALLSQRDGIDDLTPIEYAFARQDKSDAAVLVAQTLQENDELRPLFTKVSMFQPRSIMHKAAMLGQSAVVAYYLEQDDAQLEHTSASSESMLELAKQNNQDKIIAYFAALPLLKLIKTSDSSQPTQFDEQALINSIQINPAILDCRWTEGKTALHFAAARGLAGFIRLFMQQGVSVQLTDNNNLTPIDEALRFNQLIALKELINMPEAISKPLMIETLAEILNKTRPPVVGYEALENFFKQAKPNSFASYCNQQNDCYIYFLRTIGELLAMKDSPLLLDAVKTYIYTNLQQLSANTNQAQHNALQLQLLVLIFSIPASKRLALLSLISLSEQEKKQLGLVIVRTLVQPLIYNTLSTTEQLDHYQFLKQLIPSDPGLLETIASIHFCHSNLSKLPIEIILELAKVSSIESLLSYCHQRTNPILVVLTLEKLLGIEPRDNDNIGLLFKQLARELNNFNPEPSSIPSSEQILLLNLVFEPELKAFIRAILQEPDDENIQQLFETFNEQSVLRANSLLADLFNDYVSSCNVLNQPNHQAVEALLAISTPEAIRVLLDNLRPYYCSSPVDTNLQSTTLVSWMQKLESKTHRLSLSPFILHLEELYNQAQDLAKPITNAEHYLLYTALKNYAKALTTLASITLSIHLFQTGKANTKKLNTALEQLTLCFKAVITQCDCLEGLYPSLEFELKKLNTSNTITNLSDRLRKASVKIDELKRPEIISATVKTATLGNKENLNRHLIQGIALNPQGSQLILHLFNWGLHCRDYASNGMLFEPLYQLIQIATADECESLEQQANSLLRLTNKISSIITGLESSTLVPTISIKKVIAVLYKAESDELDSLLELCSIIGLDDFKKIVLYVLEAKAYHLPFELVVAETPKETEADLSSCINHVLHSIDCYATQAISYKILKAGSYCKEEDLLARSTDFNRLVNENVASAHPKAINQLIASYLPVLLNEQDKLGNQLVTDLISNLFRNTKLTVINDCIGQMTAELLNCLIKLCLSGLNNTDRADDGSSRYLLSLLCQSRSETNGRSLELIKARLGEQDLSIFNNSESLSFQNATSINGLWIPQLLSSPDFVASARLKTIKTLCHRYRFISMTLTPAEFEQQNGWLKNKMAFYNHHHDAMVRLKSNHCDSTASKVQCLEKHEQLLQFRADDCVHAILSILRESCIERQHDEPDIANKALETLYSYYNDSLTSIRSDLLLTMADYLIKTGERQTENRLIDWLKSYFPQKNHELSELSFKQTLFLYNAAGRKLGFINEANYAMTLINDIPQPLLALPDINPGLSFYDSEQRLIGTLTMTGKVKSACPLQEKISALLIANLPGTQLEQSSAVLDLLINNLLTENSLTTLYESSALEKHAWQTEQVNTRLINSSHLVQSENFAALVKHQPPSALFSLLANMKLAENAEQLFIAILESDSMRQALLSEEGQTYAYLFFDKQDSALIFANFLNAHYDKPWFTDGLELFANFARTSKPILLCKALELLSAPVSTTNRLVSERVDRVLTTLLNSEACASIVWRHFLQGSSLEVIQHLNQDHAEGLTSFFSKTHLKPVIEMLNKQSNWSLCAYQYRLVLLILANRREYLFSAQEQKTLWSGDELKQIGSFIKKHFVQRANPDKNFVIGKEILAELLFCSASYGLTDLFYNEGKFDPAVAILKLERSLLNTLAARNFLKPELKDKLSVTADNILSSTINWFDSESIVNHDIDELLNEDQALIDWKELSNQTWSMTESWTKMPLISAYLMNYTGPKQALLQLISDYLSNKRVQAKPEYLHTIALVMAKLPHRDFSLCIFTRLEELISQYPLSLDRKLLADMAKFYSLHYSKQSQESPEAKLQLLKHFGCQQKYELLVQSCNLLESEVADSDNASLLREIETQARIEAKLSKHQSSWYYPFYQFFIRLWSYGFKDNSTTCQFVPYCEKKSPYSSPTNTPETIRIPSFKDQRIEEQKNTQGLINRYQPIPENYSLAKKPAYERSFFSMTEAPNLFRPVNNLGAPKTLLRRPESPTLGF